ncbi:hypothetical protein BDL97_07G106700 [Sphagnum fallax]|nr:hypothetical protein BDL97_07G106700 [Sphagnum fallax]
MGSAVLLRRLEGKVAVITASTKGIGFAIARRLALEGAAVVISSRKQKNVDEAVAKLKAEGLDVFGLACHVSFADQRANLIKSTIDKYGQIDILVSNAAANPSNDPIVSMSEKVLDKLWEINVKASIQIIQALAAELAPKTRVNGIAPGFVPTRFSAFLTESAEILEEMESKILLKRLGTTDDMAAAAAFLASEDASYITGETLVIAGGVQSRL